MQKKNFNKIIFYLCSICFIISSLLISVHYWCYNEDFYRKQHQSLTLYGEPIAKYIGISEEQLDELTHFTLSYLNDPNASLDKVMNIKGVDREVFTNDEKAHMVDVQKLNLISKYIMYICIFIFVLCMIYILVNKCSFKELYLCSKKIFKIFLIIILVLGTWIIIDFDSFWTFFHHIFFAGNDLWLLDLRKDILIMIVPPEFFFHLVSVITITFIMLVILYYLLLYFLSRRVND